jgi:hypothetical protein
LDFVRDFESYLEFEKKHFIKKLGFYKTLEFKAIELKEIKRSLNVCKKYEEDVYFDDGNNYIYVDRDCPTSEPYNNVIAVEFVVKIKKTEEAYNKLQFFISQEIEIANELDALDNNELKCGNNEFEFDFKTRRLGSLLKPLTLLNEHNNEETYVFSKFWSDDDLDIYFSFARVNDFITSNFGEKPLLVNILSGDVALYRRGKQALRDLREGNVKNPGIASYLFNISEFESKENIIDKENIKWQYKNVVSGGNEAGVYQRGAGATKVLAISAPTRYIHSASNVVSLADMESVSALCKALNRRSFDL